MSIILQYPACIYIIRSTVVQLHCRISIAFTSNTFIVLPIGGTMYILYVLLSVGSRFHPTELLRS